jgi:hypothetical protein
MLMSATKKYAVLTLFWLATSLGELSACDIEPINSSDSNSAVLVVKAEKELVGGKVMVFNSNKELVTVSRMKRRKLEIDFSAADFGAYTVRIVKGNESKDFHFMKK